MQASSTPNKHARIAIATKNPTPDNSNALRLVLKKDCNLTPPFYVRCINGETEIGNTFCIELEDDEVFDPKQLQLVKSDYEVEFLPYGIVSNHIVYKGKEIVMYDEDGYRDKGWNRPFVCTEYYK